MEVKMQNVSIINQKIILLNQQWREKYQEFYCKAYCKKCLYNSYCQDSIVVMGTSSKSLEKLENIDILMIGDKPAYPEDPKKSVIQVCKDDDKETIKNQHPGVKVETLEDTLCEFYKSYKYGTQKNRELIFYLWNELDNHGYSWVYTDYLKNYYSKENSKCTVFLKEQICMFKPKCIITFGNPVYNFFKKQFLIRNIYGGISDNHGKCISINIPCENYSLDCCWIISMFPGGANTRFQNKSQMDELINTIKKCCPKDNQI